MIWDFLVPYINELMYSILVVLIALITLFTKSYIREKGKDKIIRNRNKELEKLRADHRNDLEKLKKEHQLDIEKRKYKYESKKEQYINFFNTLDSYSGTSSIELQKEMTQIISDFNNKFIEAITRKDLKGQSDAASLFSEKSTALIAKSGEGLYKVKQETNTIRLVASDDVVATLDNMEEVFQTLFELSTKMMKDLRTQIIKGDQKGLERNRRDLELVSNKATQIKDLLRQKMRRELDEI